MKRFISLIMILSVLSCLSGCAAQNASSPDTVEFYYQRASYVYGVSDGVISSEPREITNQVGNLPYLLSLYLRGPLDETLRTPFPADCRLLSVTQDGSTLCVTLDSTFTTLKNMELSIACACLAKTCFSLADVTQVQIRSIAQDAPDNVNVIISIDSLLLYDSSGIQHQSVAEESE